MATGFPFSKEAGLVRGVLLGRPRRGLRRNPPGAAWFDIRDLRCPTPSACIAAGTIDDKKGHSKGIVLRTTDSGGHWVPSDVTEQPLSLFFLDASQGWMVTERGLCSTSDGGTSWKKLE